MKFLTHKFEVPILPFENLVLYPNSFIPLYIFDPNYIGLIESSVKKDSKVAIALSDDFSPFLGINFQNKNKKLYPRKIASEGVIEIIKEYPDGSKYVLVKGTRRICLETTVQSQPYLVCKASYLDEIKQKNQNFNHQLDRLRKILRWWINTYLEDNLHKNYLLDNQLFPEHVVDQICTFLIHDRELKQFFLECNNFDEKVLLLNMLLPKERPLHEDIYRGNLLKTFEFSSQFIKPQSA